MVKRPTPSVCSRPAVPIETATQIMSRFSERTGLNGERPPRRYLWTDAFAVCNFLELYAKTGEEVWRKLALRLVDQVHEILGRHHPDDPRTGWLSSLAKEEGRSHPTAAGLRIGKDLNERGQGEPFDERGEWDRDGQYFHYLTKWMHALARVSSVSGEARYLRWAIELAQAARAAFVRPSRDGRTRMYWKMSIDLRRPLVPSMGQHDPLDGLLTFTELQSAGTQSQSSGELPDLGAEIADMVAMCRGADWTTADTLGLGGLLSDAYRVAQLEALGESVDGGLLDRLLRSSLLGLTVLGRHEDFAAAASKRLAFRELGLAIGLAAVARTTGLVAQEPAPIGGLTIESHLEALKKFLPLGERITEFWLEPANRESAAWTSHLDINSVMLATSLAPAGFLSI